MKVENKFFNEKNELVVVNSPGGDEINGGQRHKVVFAHVDIINDNGFKLSENSIEVTRKRYPVLVEHADNRVEDVVGYIITDGKPNSAGEFTGDVVFYNTTEQGRHAQKLWEDGVLNELSVSYYLKEYEILEDEDFGIYYDVKHAILKEVSIVSVGADRQTGATENSTENTNEVEEVDEVESTEGAHDGEEVHHEEDLSYTHEAEEIKTEDPEENTNEATKNGQENLEKMKILALKALI